MPSLLSPKPDNIAHLRSRWLSEIVTIKRTYIVVRLHSIAEW